MKILIASVFVTLIALVSHAQKASVTWGEEFKMRKGSTDLSVIYADKTGFYVKESHLASKSFFAILPTLRESATLIKLNGEFIEEYRNDFNKELKGKEFESFFFIKSKLFVLASEYSKKEKTLNLYGAEIDKSNGTLAGEWTQITSWTKDEKNEDISFRASYNFDSSRMVLVSTIEGREKNNYEVRQFDDKLKAVEKPIAITNEFERNLFRLEDVIYTTTGNVVLVGKEFEYQEGKRKKAKFLEFKNYNIRMYDKAGKQVKQINTEISGKWLMSSKVAQTPSNELVLAAFYSNAKRANEVNGMLLQRINITTGEVLSTSEKEINTSMITKVELDSETDDGDEESKKERKERERLEKIQNEEDSFSRYMRFRNFVYTADKGIVIIAEEYDSYTTTSSSYQGNGQWRTTTTLVYECENLMMSKMDVGGKLSWLNVLPKRQREVIQLGSNTSFSGVSFSSYFMPNDNRPFYAGFGLLPSTNALTIVFNDHANNKDVLQLGQSLRKISSYGRSECFAVTLNTLTGKYTRTSLFSNRSQPTAMPRLGAVLGNNMFLIGKEDRFLAKTKIVVGRLTIK